MTNETYLDITKRIMDQMSNSTPGYIEQLIADGKMTLHKAGAYDLYVSKIVMSANDLDNSIIVGLANRSPI
jgi:hypothetical protein